MRPTDDTTAAALDRYGPLIGDREFAELAGVSVHAPRAWRQRRQGPPYRKIGPGARLVRYETRVVVSWLLGRGNAA